MKGKTLTRLMILSLIPFFLGCAETMTYLIDVRYIPEKKAPPTSKLVGICPFEDARKQKGTVTIGTRHRPRDKVDLLKLEGANLSESVTQAVKDYFVERGFQITDCKGWDKSAEGLERLPTNLFLVVAGRIHSFEVEARSGISITETQYRVKVDAFIGQITKRKMITRTIESAPKTKKMGFDPEEVKARLNGILTEVIQKLFRGKC